MWTIVLIKVNINPLLVKILEIKYSLNILTTDFELINLDPSKQVV